MTPIRLLHSQQIILQLGVTVLARPKIEWNRCQFVDQRLGVSIFCEVHSLDVGLAGIAAFHTNEIELARCKHRECFLVLLATAGAHDAPKLPFSQAEGTDHGSGSTIAHLAHDAEARLASTERT